MGASIPIMQLITTFLSNRTMTVSVGETARDVVRSRLSAATGPFFPSRGERAAARRIFYSPEDEEDIPEERSVKNSKWRSQPPRTFKYVDDNIQVDWLFMETATRTREGGQDVRDRHACGMLEFVQKDDQKGRGSWNESQWGGNGGCLYKRSTVL